jgi:YegS/Rv2252/BmrU family lipid kinase
LKLLFLVNVRSGARRGVDYESLIRKSCDWAEIDITTCGQKEDLDAIIAAAEESGRDAVIAVGGDGTVHEIAKRLIGRRPALGIVPTGSGNGLARHLRLPMDAASAIAVCRTARPVSVDTAEANGLPYIGVMGLGFDALIAHEFAAHHARGLRTYLKVGAAAILHYRPETYEIVADGETMTVRAYAVAVANGSQYGNNARVAANASVRDGLLDLVIFRDVPVIAAPIITYRVFTGTAHRSRGVIARKVSEVVIRRKSAGHAHLDGEPLTLGEEIRVAVRPRSLNVLVACDPDTI